MKTVMHLLLLLGMAMPLCLPATVSATEVPVNLQALLLLGLKENFGLQAARLRVPAAREAVNVEEGSFDVELFANSNFTQVRIPFTSSLSPQNNIDTKSFSGEGGLRKRFDNGLSATLSLQTSRTTDNLPDYLGDFLTTEALNPRFQSYLTLDLSQPLLRNAGSATNMLALNLSRGQSRQAEFVFLQQAQNLALGIEIGFYDLLLARSAEKFRREAWQLTRTLLKGNQRKLDAGIIPISEVQEAETALAGRELEYVLAQQQREIQAHRLDGLLNNRLPESLATPKVIDDEFTELILPYKADVPNIYAALKGAESSRPDLLIAAIDIENSSLSEAAAKNRSRPRLDLNLHLQSAGLAGKERQPGNSPFQGDWGNSLASLAAGDGYQWGAGLQFTYPLGNRSLKAAYRGAQYQRRQAQFSRRELLTQIETELRERRTQVLRLGQLVDISTRFQKLAEISFKQEGKRQEEGLSDTFRVLTFQEKMISARIDRVTALVEYNKSLASFNYAMGINLLRHGIVANLSAEEIRFEEY